MGLKEELGFSEERLALIYDPHVRSEIRTRTVDMIRAAEHVGTVFFLDHNARPLAHLFRKGFPLVFPDKSLPAIRFLNLGSEKQLPVNHYQDRTKDPREHWQRPSYAMIETEEDVVNIFGDENTQVLKQLLHIGETHEQRLIVDETVSSGRTQKIAMRVTSALDKVNTYSFFDFWVNQNRVLVDEVPWLHIYPNYTLIDSFLTKAHHESNGQRHNLWGGKTQERVKVLKKELDTIASGIT